MADKGGKALVSLAAFGAAFGARKLVTLAWKQVTGKEPPTDPQDPQVGIGEALSWAVLTGVAIETARLLAVRTASRRMRHAGGAER